MSPWAPKKPCTFSGCPALTDGGRCPKHQRQEAQEYATRRKADPTQRIYPSSYWRQVRAQHLASEPLCRTCKAEGRLTAADTVDHVIPVKDGGSVYDDDNLRSLCASCHSRQHAKDGTRWGR